MNETYGDEYKNRVLSEFQRVHKDIKEGREETQQAIKELSDKLDQLKDGDITDMKVDIALLKLKASLWGGMVGFGASIIVAVVSHLIR